MIRFGDMVIIMLCAAGVGSAYWLTWQSAGAGKAVVVRGADEPERRIALDREMEMTVRGPRGESRIAIRPGGVRFLSSPCPGKYCVRSGWLERAGAFTACLPNGVSLTLVGGESGYDGIGY